MEVSGLPVSVLVRLRGEAEVREWARYRAKVVAMMHAGTLGDYWRTIPRLEAAQRERVDAARERLGRAEVLRRMWAEEEITG